MEGKPPKPQIIVPIGLPLATLSPVVTLSDITEQMRSQLAMNVCQYPCNKGQGLLDHQRARKPAQKLHAHSVQYAHKLVTARRAMESSNASHSQVLEPGASINPPDPH
eukprot:1148881-Pelagomonas_calceolata.AAC.16